MIVREGGFAYADGAFKFCPGGCMVAELVLDEAEVVVHAGEIGMVGSVGDLADSNRLLVVVAGSGIFAEIV